MNASPLRSKAICPHCWTEFDSADVLWIAAHAELRGDLRLGPDEMMRFLPSAFSLDGCALDPRDAECRELACPRCHLRIPREILEVEPLFVSILGTPSAGKSYYLAALTWQLRQLLPRIFHLRFGDADPAANVTLLDYEKQLFVHPHPERLIPLADLIQKTAATGDLYDLVAFGDHVVRYLRPFLFNLQLREEHVLAPRAKALARLLCLYDNAGEHFLPGSDVAAAPVTQHLARSQFFLYLFDPTQDPRFRRTFQKEYALSGAGMRADRQEVVLHEAMARLKRLKSMPSATNADTPLFVVVTKADLWRHQLKDDVSVEPWTVEGKITRLDRPRIKHRSHVVRALLDGLCPEVVSAAEDVSKRVTYVPVSALGTQPTALKLADGRQVPAIRPADVRPMGVLVPLLLGLAEMLPGVVPTAGHSPLRATNGQTQGRAHAMEARRR